MKKLYLIRHAKSSWDFPDLTDIERPLNNRGKRDAPMMGKRLAELGVSPDLIVTSPAKRARKTAKMIAKETGYPAERIIINKKFYGAGVTTLLKAIRTIENKFDTVFLFGHNPELTALVNKLTHQQIYNVPTCGVCSIVFDTESWNFITEGSGKLLFYDYPKNLPR